MVIDSEDSVETDGRMEASALPPTVMWSLKIVMDEFVHIHILPMLTYCMNFNTVLQWTWNDNCKNVV